MKQFCCIATCPATVRVVTQAKLSVGAAPCQGAGLAVLDRLIDLAAAARRLDRHGLLIPGRRSLRQDVRPHYLRAGTQAATQAELYSRPVTANECACAQVQVQQLRYCAALIE